MTIWSRTWKCLSRFRTAKTKHKLQMLSSDLRYTPSDVGQMLCHTARDRCNRTVRGSDMNVTNRKRFAGCKPLRLLAAGFSEGRNSSRNVIMQKANVRRRATATAIANKESCRNCKCLLIAGRKCSVPRDSRRLYISAGFAAFPNTLSGNTRFLIFVHTRCGKLVPCQNRRETVSEP